jgi:hypothetical protein
MQEPLLSLDKISADEGHKLIDEAIKQRRASILALKLQISDLQSQRNYFAPICRLPSEILCKIFYFVKTPLRYMDRDRSFKWIRLTHVCRHWRNIAIASPTLWANDPWPLRNIPFLKEKLSRSKGVPLEIYNQAGITNWPEALRGLELLFECSQRIKHLSIDFDAIRWPELQDILPKSAPQLESLSLNNFFFPTSSLKRVLYDTPKLRHLALTYFQIDWCSSSHFKHALTYLKLHDIEPRPTWKQFIDMLKGLPDLEVLDLVEALPTHTDEKVSSDFGSINLSSLRTLSLDYLKPREVQTFLSYITFPAATQVNIRCVDNKLSDLQAHLPGCLSAFVHSISNMLPPDISFQTLILSSKLTGFSELIIHFKLFIDALEGGRMLHNNSTVPHFDVGFCWSTPRSSIVEDTSAVLNDVFNSDMGILLQNISHLHLDESTQLFNRDTLANVAAKLPNVRFLMVSEQLHSIVEDLLQSGTGIDDTGSADSASGALYFPALSSIYLHVPKNKKYNTSRNYPYSLPIESLYRCLVRRHKASAKIEKLTLKYWRKLGKDDIDLLKEIVPDVIWDNKETSSDNDFDYIE